MNFINQSYVILDFETANSNLDSICQIGMIKVKHGQIIDSFNSYIKPEPLYFSSMNIAVHGITKKNVIDQPTFSELWPMIIEFIGDYQIIAHFAQFDMNCLKNVLAKTDLSYQLEFLCSYRLAKELIPANNHKLTYLSKNITNYNYQAHDALADCHATYQLINYCFTNYDLPHLVNTKYQIGTLSDEEGYQGFVYKKKK